MVLRKTAALVLGLSATVALVTGPAAATTSVHRIYRGGLPAGGVFLPQDHGIGGTWMRIPAGARALSVVLHDEHSPQVASDVQFVISEYEPLVGTKRFCGASKVLAIPAGARALYVRVLDAGSLRCDPPGVPTTGTIDVVFRR